MTPSVRLRHFDGREGNSLVKTMAVKRFPQDRRFTERVASPDPGAASNLFTFLAQRLSASFDNLGCDRLIKGGNPVRLRTRDGVAVNASFTG